MASKKKIKRAAKNTRRKKEAGAAMRRIGDLNEARGATLLKMLCDSEEIISFREANEREQSQRCDYIVKHKNGTFGLQIKSSNAGIVNFMNEEKEHPIPGRSYKVLVFKTNIGTATDKAEAGRLARNIRTFIKQLNDIH